VLKHELINADRQKRSANGARGVFNSFLKSEFLMLLIMFFFISDVTPFNGRFLGRVSTSINRKRDKINNITNTTYKTYTKPSFLIIQFVNIGPIIHATVLET